MAQLKFYRKSTAPSSPVAGAIWFNTSDKTIQIYTGTEWEKYAGNLKDATWSTDKRTLTITKHDGSSIALDFSDMASATVMGKMLTAVGLDTDGTFKNNATNYGGSATSIGGEITAIDAKLKSVSDLVGTTSVDSQITTAKNALIGNVADDKDKLTIYGAKAEAALLANGARTYAEKYTDLALQGLTNEVSSTAGEKVVVSVNQTNGKVDAVTVSLNDIASANELLGVKATAEAAQTSAQVSTAITNAINALDATVSDEHDPNVKVSVTETDGKLTGVTVTTADIASAATLSALQGRVEAFLDGNKVEGTVDTLHEIQNWMNGEGVVATELTAAIAAEAKLREEADAALAESVANAITTAAGDATTKADTAEANAKLYVDARTGVDFGVGGTGPHNDYNLAGAIELLFSEVDKAAAAGVTSLNGKTGAVTIATGTSNGSIKVGDADVAVKGLRSAAFTERTDYASAIEFQGLSTLVGTSNNGTNTGIFKIIEDNEKVTANALTDLDTRLQAVNALLEWAEF